MQIPTEPGSFAYAPCYCEENIWHLAADPRLEEGRRWVVFISNRQKSCAFWCHRAAEEEGSPVLWDYHVVLLIETTSGPKVFDLDSTAGFPMSLTAYLMVTFPYVDEALGGPPLFGVVDAERYRSQFASDRSHMRDEDGWFVPPPDWPTIGPDGEDSNLFSYVDMDEAWVDERLDLEAFKARFTRHTDHSAQN